MDTKCDTDTKSTLRSSIPEAATVPATMAHSFARRQDAHTTDLGTTLMDVGPLVLPFHGPMTANTFQALQNHAEQIDKLAEIVQRMEDELNAAHERTKRD